MPKKKIAPEAMDTVTEVSEPEKKSKTAKKKEVKKDEVVNTSENAADDTEELDEEVLTDEDKAEEEEIQKLEAELERMYEKRRYRMLSSNQKKKTYKNEYIVGATDDYKTEKDLIQDEASELMNAAQAIPPKLLEGIVYGYEITEHGIPLVHVMRPGKPNFMIKIPVSQFFMYSEKDYENTPEGLRALEYELKSRINSTIEFVVYDLDEKDMIAYGSRLKAMEIRSRIYYKPRRAKEKAEIVEGTRAMATVVSVKTNRLKVEVLGVETELRSEDLSYKALHELTQEFKVGQKFEVIVHDIEPLEYVSMDKKYKLYKIKASRREALTNPADKFFNQFTLGQKVGGIVKTQTPAGIFVDLAGKMDVLCPPPAVGRLLRGDACIVEITLKDEDKKRLFGRIV